MRIKHLSLSNGWAILGTSGLLDVDSFSQTRREAIEKFIKDGNVTWNECRKKYGWKAVKVKVSFTLNNVT